MFDQVTTAAGQVGSRLFPCKTAEHQLLLKLMVTDQNLCFQTKNQCLFIVFHRTPPKVPKGDPPLAVKPVKASLAQGGQGDPPTHIIVVVVTCMQTCYMQIIALFRLYICILQVFSIYYIYGLYIIKIYILYIYHFAFVGS